MPRKKQEEYRYISTNSYLNDPASYFTLGNKPMVPTGYEAQLHCIIRYAVN
jgi:hypothetical protein